MEELTRLYKTKFVYNRPVKLKWKREEENGLTEQVETAVEGGIKRKERRNIAKGGENDRKRQRIC